ncbi:hypothetical protein SEPCBS119000_000734 [Sporothrix epigloea]|uniref:Late endosomal/lysosomal adaptor and MAPK and MTOR activator domain-containing protein n=1 Tax=Sporothrix epigloea TaxID=1892477 RepID=A0ABP0D9D7_9PEZI
MGNCSSCIGARRGSIYDENDQSRPLFEDDDGAHYGSFGEQTINDQDDAQESQREFEALQNLVARTSDNMVDVFDIAPQRPNPKGPPAQYALGIPDNRFAQYQNLLAKLSADNGVNFADPDAHVEEYVDIKAVSTPRTCADVLPVKADATGPFVGSFTDAAKAEASATPGPDEEERSG